MQRRSGRFSRHRASYPGCRSCEAWRGRLSSSLLPRIYDPPEGFVASPGALQADVSTNQIGAVQFTVKDVGSAWTSTKITHQLKHNGKNITIVHEPKMINKQVPKKN